MSDAILLATDLDRTVLPNGFEPESPDARPRLRALARRPEVTLAYVTGRDKGLIRQAIREFELPEPAYAIGDVGTTIYDVAADWKPLLDWSDAIATDWSGRSAEDIRTMLQAVGGLRLQEPEKQNTFKVSYYARPDADVPSLLRRTGEVLALAGVRASLIWSIDEPNDTGLLDVLPASATKVHALQFLRKRLGFPEERTVFCGDSGNDLPALTSGLRAVLVRNASSGVRAEVKEVLTDRGMIDRLYEAKGCFLGMNGNYAAGVLEGVAQFFPETECWMEI